MTTHSRPCRHACSPLSPRATPRHFASETTPAFARKRGQRWRRRITATSAVMAMSVDSARRQPAAGDLRDRLRSFLRLQRHCCELALAGLVLPKLTLVLCHELAHVENDECARRILSNGTRSCCLAGANGTIEPDAVERTVRSGRCTFPSRARSVSPTQRKSAPSIRRTSVKAIWRGPRRSTSSSTWMALVSPTLSPGSAARRRRSRGRQESMCSVSADKNGMAAAKAVVSSTGRWRASSSIAASSRPARLENALPQRLVGRKLQDGGLAASRFPRQCDGCASRSSASRLAPRILFRGRRTAFSPSCLRGDCRSARQGGVALLHVIGVVDAASCARGTRSQRTLKPGVDLRAILAG